MLHIKEFSMEVGESYFWNNYPHKALSAYVSNDLTMGSTFLGRK